MKFHKEPSESQNQDKVILFKVKRYTFIQREIKLRPLTSELNSFFTLQCLAAFTSSLLPSINQTNEQFVCL